MGAEVLIMPNLNFQLPWMLNLLCLLQENRSYKKEKELWRWMEFTCPITLRASQTTLQHKWVLKNNLLCLCLPFNKCCFTWPSIFSTEYKKVLVNLNCLFVKFFIFEGLLLAYFHFGSEREGGGLKSTLHEMHMGANGSFDAARSTLYSRDSCIPWQGLLIPAPLVICAHWSS